MRTLTLQMRTQTGQLAPWVQCVLVWASALLALTVVGHVAVRVLDLREGYDPVVGVAPDSIPGLWARWDTPYYVNIAKQGYPALPYAVGYFPLYPLLIAGLSRLTGLGEATAGMLISQLSYLGAILLFYRLARVVRDEHAFAWRAVLTLVLFPTSFFFFASYAEPLSLMFSLAGLCLVMQPQPRYVWGGLMVGLASAARPVGWLLNVITGVEFLRRRQYDARTFLKVAAGGLLAVAGAALFVFYLYTITGSWTAIQDAQQRWQRRFLPPWMSLGMSLSIAFSGSQVQGDWFLYAMNWVDLLFSLYALALTGVSVWLAWKKQLPLSLAVYLVGALLFLLSFTGSPLVPLWGMTRWVGGLVPLHFVLGMVLARHPRWQWAVWALFGFLQACAFGWWVSGRWVG